ncbi:hypothetical protein CYLTODRAFT_125356 [Cylindrobasidium torrendii FP15055 ss-10]|uniref:DUF6532 domain-containing protein n=1 Tax=Cylindrobasidium torrendii FP15055 ss-10 TaxID=1314674 RepID=A0A0D7B2L9_9AGAR|nr:hypothetical protein CYLTODRAFT_125356 [Cylindrobasidium torrendii FP15055 ss-10]
MAPSRKTSKAPSTASTRKSTRSTAKAAAPPASTASTRPGTRSATKAATPAVASPPPRSQKKSAATQPAAKKSTPKKTSEKKAAKEELEKKQAAIREKAAAEKRKMDLAYPDDVEDDGSSMPPSRLGSAAPQKSAPQKSASQKSPPHKPAMPQHPIDLFGDDENDELDILDKTVGPGKAKFEAALNTVLNGDDDGNDANEDEDEEEGEEDEEDDDNEEKPEEEDRRRQEVHEYESDDEESDGEADAMDIEDATPETPVRRSKRKTGHVVDDDVEVPVRKSRKICEADFNPESLKLQRVGKKFTSANVVTMDAYPTISLRGKFYFKALKQAALSEAWGTTSMRREYNRLVTDRDLADQSFGFQEYQAQATRAKFGNGARSRIDMVGIPVRLKDEEKATQETADLAHWYQKDGGHLFGGLDYEDRTFDRMLLGQSSIFAEIIADFLFRRRGKNDIETYQRIIDAQRIPSATVALVGTAIGHAIDEYASGRYQHKHFTSAAATEYDRIHGKLVAWGERYPAWVEGWQRELFAEVCRRANKPWLVKKSLPEDDEELTALLEAAEAAAVARLRA